jgi:hypothetical protein
MKKQIKLRYFGQVPLEETTPSNVPTVEYHTAETTDNGTSNTVNTGGNNTTITTTSITTQINNGSNPNNTSINVNMAGVGINMNVSGMDNGTTTTSQTTSYTTTTTSSSSSSNSQPVKNNTVSNQQVATTNTGCKAAMTPSNFETMKKSVESKPFSETKMSTAKIATKNNCVSVNQVKEICKLFSMDEDKLDYAKYAYDYCVDKGNYFQVSEVFSFSTTTDEFNEFLEKH